MSESQTSGPRKTVRYGDSEITLLGTAHVSAASAREVSEALATGMYDACAVELCASRHERILSADKLPDLDLFQVIREGKATMIAANLALGAYQQRLADQFGIEPGAEMKAACVDAAQADVPVLLIDRDVGTTLRRVYRSLPWWQRFSVIPGLFAGLISSDKVDEAEIERLKEGDILESAFSEFASRSPAMFRSLIDERDRYMAARLMEEADRHGYRHIFVVIGAGHLEGIAHYLEQGLSAERNVQNGQIENIEERGTTADPATVQAELNVVPPNRSWTKALPWLITVLVLAGFAVGFMRSPQLGWDLVATWVLLNGGAAAVGALLAGGHPATILVSFLAAPLTSLNPTIGVGMFSAGVEVYFRRPRISDFEGLRQDVTKVSGWWRNRVTRALLVFLLSSLGSAIATYVAGFRIWEKLVG